MLRPFLIVGVGGSGGKTLRGLRHSLALRLQQAGWTEGIPSAWQLLHVDTPLAQDGADYALPFMPPGDYKGLVASGAAYETVFTTIAEGRKIPTSVIDDVKRFLPDPKRVPVDVTKGAGQYRAVGRAVVLSQLDAIAKTSREAINKMSDASSVAQLQSLGELLGAKNEGGVTANPTVIVVSSIAGGSGAGQYLDVIEAIKSTVKSQPWAYQFFSILYAPDVFDQIKGAAGIASNALATVAETMSGFWTQNPSNATIELFKSKGLNPSYGGARDRVGAAYPFIVGRQNSKVSFDNQGEVYSAVATSLASWLSDDKVQDDIDAYVTGNWTANVGAGVLPDATRLMRPIDQSPPFSSLGFGRVSLGREKFLDYAAERFARSGIDQMLYAHTEEDPNFTQRTQDEWVDLKATQSLEAFIKESGLDEETEQRNDVIDALRAGEALEELVAEFRHDVRDRAAESGSFDKAGGLDINEWQDRFVSLHNDRVERYLARDTANRQQRLDAWLSTAPSTFIQTVERAITVRGLPVTVELLRRLSESVRNATDGLKSEAGTRRHWIQRLPGMITEELSQAPNQDSIRPENDVVDAALDRIEQTMEWASEARLRDSAALLLAEFRVDYLEPLRNHLAGSLVALRQQVGQQVLSDGRDNEYEFWPRRKDPSVPRKFRPAPNERLLVPHTDYPEEFEDLVVSSSSEERFDDAMNEIVTSVLVGPSKAQIADPKARWSLIDVPRTWRPAVTAETSQKVATIQKPSFAFAFEPEVYAERSKRWMLRQGTAFEAYITQDLHGFFDKDHLSPKVYNDRKNNFREEFSSALGSAEPLVKLNPILLAAVHGKAIGEGTRLVFSSIPFAEGTEMYTITKSILTAQGIWDENVSQGWFRDAKVDSIEVFAMSGFPFQPIVMDSVMQPIVRGWLGESNGIDSRAALWKWKRARLLREAAPVDPQVFDSMLRGWFVAKALSQLDVDNKNEIQGPKLKVWDADSSSWASFPHPLLYGGIAPAYDFPGIIMESLSIALVLCNSEVSLEPLRAYHALLDLGASESEPSKTLTAWIRTGTTLSPRGPVPAPERAGSSDVTFDDRKNRLIAFFDGEIAEFKEDVATPDDRTSIYKYPVSWEIRKEVLEALNSLRDSVAETKTEKSGI
jgi:hypothetical protein